MSDGGISAPAPQTPGTPGEKKNNTKVILVVVIVVLVLLAWQGLGRFTGERMVERAIERAADGNVDVDFDTDGEGTVTVSGENGGTFQYSAGGAVEVPSDWPNDMPIMDGGTVSYVGTMNPQTGEPGAVVMFTTNEPVSAVSAYYTQALADNGWTIESTMNAGGTVILGASKDERQASIYVAGDENGTSVTVSIGG